MRHLGGFLRKHMTISFKDLEHEWALRILWDGHCTCILAIFSPYKDHFHQSSRRSSIAMEIGLPSNQGYFYSYIWHYNSIFVSLYVNCFLVIRCWGQQIKHRPQFPWLSRAYYLNPRKNLGKDEKWSCTESVSGPLMKDKLQAIISYLVLPAPLLWWKPRLCSPFDERCYEGWARQLMTGRWGLQMDTKEYSNELNWLDP